MTVPKWVSVAVIALLVLGIGAPLLKLYSGSGGDAEKAAMAGAMSLDLPDFAKRNAKTMKAYEVASTTRKEAFGFLTCHCGCGMHAMEHRGKAIPKMHNLRDCFIRDDGTWEYHAAMDCPYCVDLAVMADEMLSKGATLREIRELIDTKYNQIDPSMRAMDMNP